jgi:hypothetical protein
MEAVGVQQRTAFSARSVPDVIRRTVGARIERERERERESCKGVCEEKTRSVQLRASRQRSECEN